MLDFTQVERMLTTLRDAEDRRAEKAEQASLGAALLPLALARERRHVEAFFNQIEQAPDWGRWSGPSGLVEAGVSAIVGLLRGLR